MAQDLEPTPPVPQDDGPFNNNPNSAYSPVNLSLQAHFGIGKRSHDAAFGRALIGLRSADNPGKEPDQSGHNGRTGQEPDDA